MGGGDGGRLRCPPFSEVVVRATEDCSVLLSSMVIQVLN